MATMTHKGVVYEGTPEELAVIRQGLTAHVKAPKLILPKPVEPEVHKSLPDCFQTKVEQGARKPLFKVWYKSAAGKTGIYGVVLDLIGWHNQRELGLRPISADGKLYGRAFKVPAYVDSYNGGRVLGLFEE